MRVLCCAAVAAALLVTRPAAAGVAESWYVTRARANVKIGNHAAAIEAWRKVLEGNPGHREASRGLGRSLLVNGETDRAVAAWDRHLARFPDDAEIAFEQARLLGWSRYAYRAADAIRYLRLGLRSRDDPARRRDLARLLGRDRRTLDEALGEYRTLLASAPSDRALRDEYLKLLLWEKRHRGEAMAELERRLRADPGDEHAARQLARLVAEDPRRATEAAARYEALLARRPGDPDLLLGRARALARAGRRAEARDAYARALAARPSTEARLERAELLAAEPATRDQARAEYEAVLRAEPGSRRARVGLARVLGARRETSGEAAAEYRTVLASRPADVEAHAGLARAYAWGGDPDRALAHADAAARAGRPPQDVQGLARDLRRGREPAAGGGARALAQGPGGAELSMLAGFAAGSADPSPFTTTAIEAGVVTADGGAASVSGPYAVGRATWRPGPGSRLDLEAGWDGARRGGEGLSFAAGLERSGDDRAVAFTIRRFARRDSFRAYAGEETAEGLAGAASELVAELRARRGSLAAGLELSGRGGAVSAEGQAAVFTAGLAGRAWRELAASGGLRVSGALAAEVVHHARDLSGAEGRAAGIFSPPLWASLSPRLVLVHTAGARGEVSLEGGPALQAVTGSGGGVRLGGDARLALARRLGERLRVEASLRGERLADAYERLEGGLALVGLFP
jgi:tetratricopeptide (TPR) repeat protein